MLKAMPQNMTLNDILLALPFISQGKMMDLWK